MPKLNQRGVVHLLVPLILIAGLLAGVYLVTSGNPLKLFSHASNPPIVFKSPDGKVLPLDNNGVSQAASLGVLVEITSTLGPPVSVSGPVGKGTASYRAGFSPTEVHASIFKPYQTEPTVYNISLKNTNNIQFYWVEFKGVDGKLDRRVAKIQIISASVSGPISTSTPSPSPTPVPTPSPVSNAFSMEVKISSNIGVGTTDFPNVFIDNAVNLGAFEYTLKFDSAKLKVLNMTLGSFLGSTGRQASQLGPIIDNVKGTVNFGGYTLGANPPGPNGKGVLAIFNVQALAPGSTSITISYAKVTDPTGTKIQPVGNLISGTANITATAKRVFVTSTTYNGNLGGLSGADAKCQERANSANLGGSWKAWLSDSTTSATSRLSHYKGSYKLINGMIVANNWVDLTDGSLRNKINLNEYGKVNGSADLVWTNTNYDGSVLNNNAKNCLNWTSSSTTTVGIMGNSGSVDSNWTNNTAGLCSISNALLYCFEQ